MYNNEKLILVIILPHSFLGQIMAEETNGNITVYIYDASGMPIGMQYHAASYADNVWNTYWYEKNLFGDIVAVYNHSGTKLVSYVYDAWGTFTTTYYNSGGVTPAAKNPFSYRGYYYDADLGLYYLQTRYYDSNTGRFINADGVGYLGENGDINSYNLFAYCSNNPIMFADPTGHGIITSLIVAFAVGGLISGGIDAGMQLRENGGDWSEVKWSSVVNSFVVGGSVSASTLAGAYYLGPIIAGTGTVSASSAAAAFATSVGISASAGAIGFIAQEALAGRGNELTFESIIGHTGIATFESAYSFGIGGMLGSIGTVGQKGKFFTKEWIKKMVLGQEFLLPIKYPLDRLKKDLWG